MGRRVAARAAMGLCVVVKACKGASCCSEGLQRGVVL